MLSSLPAPRRHTTDGGLLPGLLPAGKIEAGPRQEDADSPFHRLMRKVIPRKRDKVVLSEIAPFPG